MPLLCCGESKRHRFVPVARLIQSSGPPAAGGCPASARPDAPVTVSAAAAPRMRFRNPRRCVVSEISEVMSSSPSFLCAGLPDANEALQLQIDERGHRPEIDLDVRV